jgi:hypothetical protein
MFPSSGEGVGEACSIGPLEKCDLNQWTITEVRSF